MYLQLGYDRVIYHNLYKYLHTITCSCSLLDSGWLKIKPDYVDSLSDELDLLILGGYFGVGVSLHTHTHTHTLDNYFSICLE